MHPARTVKKAVSKVSHYIIRATFSHDAMRALSDHYLAKIEEGRADFKDAVAEDEASKV
jgi:hypothetical protein